MQVREREKEDRRDWIIVLLILLFGFLCILLASGWALRLTPSWRLDSDMESNLDPNGDFLTNKPVDFYEPLDPSILTQPVWADVFLTPGASFKTWTPVSQANTPIGTNTPASTLVYSPTAINITNTPTVIGAIPTNTPKPPPTNTPVTPLPTTDLAIAKNDGGVTAVNPGDTIIYTVRVTNGGPNSVTGAIISDPAASGLSKTAVTCSPTPGQCIIPPTIAQLESGSFTLPTLNNVDFYEITITTNVTATGSSVTNTATVAAPAGFTDPTGNNTATDTNTVNLVADLSITITDNATTYEAGAIKLLPNVPPYAYTITVSNAGPSDVTGATVSNVFPNGNIDTTFIAWGWTCTPSAGASCSAPLGLGNLNNQSVNLNSGSFVTFYLAVQVVPSPSGDLVNTATVTAPGGVTDAPGNNSATDTDNPIVSSGTTYGNIGTGPGGGITTLPQNTAIILTLSSPVTKGHPGIDIVYYEEPNGIGIFMDQIILEIGDGSNWYTVLDWGVSGSGNVGTNLDTPLPPFPLTNPSTCINEDDNCEIDATLLYGGTGATIDIDLMSWIPSGTYQYIRIRTPATDPDGAGIDGIYVVTP